MAEIIMSNGKEPDRISDHGGFFDSVVRPMFQPGHEGELYSWLKEMSLIRTSFTCPQPECTNRNMAWTSARVRDRYAWKCPGCLKNQIIRDGSFFLQVKCDFKSALQIILAWCQNVPPKTTAAYLDVKDHAVKKIYERCAKVADAFVQTHSNEFLLGGAQKVLVVDEFPGGCMLPEGVEFARTKRRNNNSHKILCFAETNNIPPMMWFHIVQAMPEPAIKAENGQKINRQDPMVEEALKEIRRHILPGSLLVANNRARCCNYESLSELKEYQTFCVDELEYFDTNDAKKLRDNLETIWEYGVDICEEVQESTRPQGQEIISSYLWRQKFAGTNSVFQYMLHHIAEVYRFT